MRVPIAEPRTRPSDEKLGYVEAAPLDFSAIKRGTNNLASAIDVYGQRQEAENNKVARFDALRKFSDFQTSTAIELQDLKKSYDPTDDQFPNKVQSLYAKREASFLAQIKPELQDEFAFRTNEYRNGVILDTEGFIQKSRLDFFKNGVDQEGNNLKTQFAQDPSDDNFVAAVDQFETLVDSADVPEQVKTAWKEQGRKDLEAISYKNKVRNGYTALVTASGTPGPAQDSITKAATELGIDPVDLATVISYETGGKFSTSIKGGKGGRYLGLIQFGPEEAAKYGAAPGQSFDTQMKAVVAYLKDRGLKPGMGINDLYSTINAGTPGRLSASDGNNTVAGHVIEMQRSHRRSAEAFMKGQIDPQGIMTDPMYDSLSFEEKQTLNQDAIKEANEVYAAQEKAAKDAESAYNNKLFIDLYEGRAGTNEINEAVQNGYLGSYEDLKKANDIYNTANAKAISARDFSAKLSGQMFFDPSSSEDNKQFDAWVGDAGLQSLNAMDQTYVNNVLGPTIRQVHAIPNSVIGGLAGMARSRDPKRQAFALNTLAQFEDWEPAAYKKVDTTVQSDVNLWRNWKDVLPQDELFAEINGGLDATQRAAKKQFRDEAEKVLTDSRDNKNFVSLDNILDKFDGWFTSTPQIPNIWYASKSLMNDYQALFKHEYVRNNGNIEKAQDSAFKQLQSMWSVTDVGGQSTLMRNAPTQQHLYPTFMGSYDYMNEQTRADNGLAPDEKFQLIADDQTQREVDKKIPPSYLVVKQGADGVWREVTQPDGRLSRQYFVMTPEMTSIENLDFQIKDLEYKIGQFGFNGKSAFGASLDPKELAAANKQQETMLLRLQELKADLVKKLPPEKLSDSAFKLLSKGSAADQLLFGGQ